MTRGSPPTAEAIADRCDYSETHLQIFASEHKDPTAEIILDVFEIDPEHRQLVSEWLQARYGEVEA